MTFNQEQFWEKKVCINSKYAYLKKLKASNKFLIAWNKQVNDWKWLFINMKNIYNYKFAQEFLQQAYFYKIDYSKVLEFVLWI